MCLSGPPNRKTGRRSDDDPAAAWLNTPCGKKTREGLLKEIASSADKEPWERFRDFWVDVWGEGGYFGKFEDNTAIPPMRYTFSDPDYGYPMETLLFFSVKVVKNDESLHWPLDVYGFVAVRDVLDRKRNMIFCCERDNCQTINQQKNLLTGPTRAVAVSVDPSYFEVKLKVKGATETEDRDFSLFASTYRSGSMVRTFTSKLSTLEMTFQEIPYSVEATVSLKVIDGSWPDGFRGEFSARIDSVPDMKFRLLDCGDDKLPTDVDGKIQLTRRVVSVELRGFLRVPVLAHHVNGKQIKRREAIFQPKRCGISSNSKLKVGSCSMEITVSWSLFTSLP
ncbi:hypothetical protein BRADI_1g43390v3 [Brachypodium distachyon]|uniref:DUF6598 domain-containing protein n=1 Tax=Brachypodium distachyon TaxID=15368 RepID=A0A0Q3H6I2_BRADI|nr:hypothetical protein BRADI_1g43390v3 [Brachypodium distachyon]